MSNQQDSQMTFCQPGQAPDASQEPGKDNKAVVKSTTPTDTQGQEVEKEDKILEQLYKKPDKAAKRRDKAARKEDMKQLKREEEQQEKQERKDQKVKKKKKSKKPDQKSRKPHEITDQQTKIMKLVTQMSKFSCTSSNSIAGTRSIAAWSRHKEDASKVTAEEETESSP